MSAPRPDGGGLATALPSLPGAACKGTDPGLWFGPEGETSRDRLRRQAKARAICGRCPERARCLAYALEEPVTWGFWGGMTEQGRKPVRRRMLRRAADAARRAAA